LEGLGEITEREVELLLLIVPGENTGDGFESVGESGNIGS